MEIAAVVKNSSLGHDVELRTGSAVHALGVAPKAVNYPSNPDIWMPFVFEPWMLDPDNRGAIRIPR